MEFRPIPDSLIRTNHVFKMCEGLYDLQKDGLFCDVTIKVGNKSYLAHKAVLGSCSEVFKAMFSSGFRETNEAELPLDGDPKAFEVLLECAYTGMFPQTSNIDLVLAILKIAHFLQFDFATENCALILDRNVFFTSGNIEKAVYFLIISDMYGLDRLKTRCKRYISKNFTKCVVIREKMTAQLMLEILKDAKLPSEKQV